MGWIIDKSGPVADVIKHVEELNYDTFVEDVKQQLAYEEMKKSKGLTGFGPPTPEVFVAELGRMDAADRDLFEQCRASVLGLLHMVPTTHAGATARYVANSTDSPRGKTVSVHVAGYDAR